TRCQAGFHALCQPGRADPSLAGQRGTGTPAGPSSSSPCALHAPEARSCPPSLTPYSAYLSRSEPSGSGCPDGGENRSQHPDAPRDETCLHGFVTPPRFTHRSNDLSRVAFVRDLHRVRLVAHLRATAYGAAPSAPHALVMALREPNLNGTTQQVQPRETGDHGPDHHCGTQQGEQAVADDRTPSPPCHRHSMPSAHRDWQATSRVTPKQRPNRSFGSGDVASQSTGVTA